MNEIRSSGIGNYSSVSLGQVRHVENQGQAAKAASLGQMLDKTLGAPASGGYITPEESLSLDAVMSGSLGGYLGTGSGTAATNFTAAGSNLLAARPESSAIGFNTVQIPHVEMPEKGELGSIQTVQIPHIPFPERDEGVALNTIQIPHVDMPEREEGLALNTVSIPKQEDGMSAVSIPSQALETAAFLPSETLGDFALASNVNEALLGLVPGETIDMSRQSAVAAVTVPSETPSANGVAYSEMPLETLAAWDISSSMPGSALALEIPEGLSGQALASSGKPFDSRLAVSVPVVEGRSEDYEAAWAGVSETLASYERGSALGLANPDALNPEILALDTEQESGAIGLVKRESGDLGYNSFCSGDMLGIVNASGFSSALSVNVNPSSQDSMLHPEKLISKIMYGYAF